MWHARADDAYILFGNRAVTRISIGLWRSVFWSWVTFILEPLAVLFVYRIWVDKTKLKKDSAADGDEVAKEYAFWAKSYWLGEILYCNASWCQRPLSSSPPAAPTTTTDAHGSRVMVDGRYSTYLASKWTWDLLPEGQRLGENGPMAALVVFSWAFWLYPVYRMEALREPKEEWGSPRKAGAEGKDGAADEEAPLDPNFEA